VVSYKKTCSVQEQLQFLLAHSLNVYLNDESKWILKGWIIIYISVQNRVGIEVIISMKGGGQYGGPNVGENIKRGVSHHPNTTCINREAREHGRRNWGGTNLNVKYPFSAYMGPFACGGVPEYVCPHL